MASEYSVNIRLNTAQVRKDLKDIKKDIDKLGRINLGTNQKTQRTEAQITKSKDAQKAAMVETRRIGDLVQKAADQGLKVDKARSAINKAALADGRQEFKLSKAQHKVALEELKTQRNITKEKGQQAKLSQSIGRQMASPIGGTRTMMGSPLQLGFAGAGMGRSSLRGNRFQFGSPAFFEAGARAGGASSPLLGTRFDFGSPAQLAFSGGPSLPIGGSRFTPGSPAFFDAAARAGGQRSPIGGSRFTFGSPAFNAAQGVGAPRVPIGGRADLVGSPANLLSIGRQNAMPVKGFESLVGSPAYYEAQNKEILRIAKQNAVPLKGFKHLVGSPAYLEDQAKQLKKLRGGPTGFRAAEYGPQQPMQGPMFPTGAAKPLNFDSRGNLLPGPLGSRQRRAGLMRTLSRNRSAAFQSAAISGGFPLLFGQGPLTALGGGLGGGLGGAFGGQMGGFAGGIIATAAIQSLVNMTNSMNEFGAALNDPVENLDKLVARIGKFDKEVVESISQLKNAGLTQVAGELASLTMKQQFTGIKAIKNLNNEMSKFQRGTADLGTRISILVAGPLTLLFKALNLIGRNADKVVKDLTSTDKIREQQEKLDTDLAKEESLLESIRKSKTELLKIPAFQKGGDTAASLRANISLQEKALEKTRERIKGNSRLLEIRKLQKQVLLSEGHLLEDQIKLEKLKAKVTRGTEDEKTVALMQKQIDMKKVENKLLIERANLQSLLNDPKATKGEKEAQEEKIKNLEREFKLVQIIANERINAADPAISRIDELNRKMRDLNSLVKQSVELSKVIGESFADSFKGVIKGTMSVQEAFRNMLNRIADYFLDVAAQMAATALQRSLLRLLGGIFNFSTTPLNDIQNPNTRLAANGGPVGMRNPYIVGERGPELFVPNQSGNIIPNHDLAGIGGSGTNIVVNVDASGSSVESDEAQAQQLGQAISQAIQAELIQQQRPGGLLYS